MYYEIMDPCEYVKQYFTTNTKNKTTDKRLVGLYEHAGLMATEILLHWLLSWTIGAYNVLFS
jgi:hypothetical protein